MKKLFALVALMLAVPAMAAPQVLTKNYLIGGWVIKGDATCDDHNQFTVFRPDGRWQYDTDSGTYKVMPGNKIVFDGGKDVHRVTIVNRNTYTTNLNGGKMTMLRCPINWDEVNLDG